MAQEPIFKSSFERRTYWILAVILLPGALYLQTRRYSNALIEPDARQLQTAIVTQGLADGKMSVFDYSSRIPDGPEFKDVYEFPFFQWLVSFPVSWGAPLGITSRLFGLFTFYLSLFLTLAVVYPLFGPGLSAWMGLIYFILPLNLLYCRAGMMDYLGLSLSLASVFFVQKIRTSPQKNLYLNIFLATLCGGLVATMKVTIWFPYAFLQGLLALYDFLHRKERDTRWLPIIGICAVQAVAAVSWLLWMGHVRAGLEEATNSEWFIGSLSERLSPLMWWTVFRSARIFIFQDWLFIPFFLGLFFTPFRKATLWASGFILLPLLLHFPPYHHDHNYYWIIQLPFIVFIAAVGMIAFTKLQGKTRLVASALLFLPLAYHLVKLQYLFGHLFRDFESELKPARYLERFTMPSDIALFNQTRLGNGYEIPFYSKRMVYFALPSTFTPPSVFYFANTWREFDHLQDYEEVWIDGTPEFPLYRTLSRGDFKWNPALQIAAFKKPHEGKAMSVGKIETCNAPSNVWISISPPKPLSLKAENLAEPLRLPAFSSISLPPQSTFGCRWEFSYLP